MPQSTAALRQKADTLRLLRHADARPAKAPSTRGTTPQRPVWARSPFTCRHGSCLALEARADGLWVRVRDDAGQEAWAPAGRVLSPEQRRAWARSGF